MNINQESAYEKKLRHTTPDTPLQKYITVSRDNNDNQEDFYQDNDYQATSIRNLHIGPQSSVIEDESEVNMILKGIRDKLNDLENAISQKENEKAGIIEDINILTQRLNSLSKSIEKKRLLHENYDRILKDSESAFYKITESTKTLLNVVKRESSVLNKFTITYKN